MIIYLLQSTLSLGLLFVVYKCLLEGERMHRFNRFYLLFGLAFSLTVPFLTLPAWMSWGVVSADYVPLNWVGSLPVQENVVVSEGAELDLIGYIYSIGVILFSMRFIVRLRGLFQQIQQNPKVHFEDYSLVLTSAEMVPFTFGSHIFVNARDYEEGRMEPELLAHELAHVRERHSADVMILELLKIGFWFQPLLYFYQRAIRLNHEFLADAAVLNKRISVRKYQHLLLDKVAASNKIHLASSFNFSLTKKRLNMMTKNTSRIRAWVLGSLTVPIFVLLLLAIARPVDAQTEPKVTSDQTESMQKQKDNFFEKATFQFYKDGKKVTKKYQDLSAEEKAAIPMPPPPPPVPPAPPAPPAAVTSPTAPVPPAPPVAPSPPSKTLRASDATSPALRPLPEGTIVEMDREKNYIRILPTDAMVPPPPPPPPAKTKSSN